MRLLTLTASIAALALTACGDASEVEPNEGEAPPAQNAQAPDRANMGAPLINDETDGALGSDAVMQGEWTMKRMAGAPAALFGEPNTEAAFSVRCSGSDLVFSRSALVEGGGNVQMALMAGGETRRIDATAHTDPLPQVIGRLAASDSFAGILAETTEPIAVAVAGGSSYGMPASPEMRDVVSGCRG